MLFESSKGILDFFFLNKENQLRACKLGLVCFPCEQGRGDFDLGLGSGELLFKVL